MKERSPIFRRKGVSNLLDKFTLRSSSKSSQPKTQTKKIISYSFRPLKFIVVPFALLLLLAGHWITASTQSSGFPPAPNIENQFANLRVYGDAAGWRNPEALGAPDSDMTNHYQGLARYPGTGTPIFYVTQKHGDGGYLHVIRFGSRDEDGERLRSNLLATNTFIEDTIPPYQDTWVRSIRFDGSWSIGGTTLPAYVHPGSMAIVNDILFVPIDSPKEDTSLAGYIVLFDLAEDRLDPQAFRTIGLDHGIDNVAVTMLDSTTYLIYMNGASGYVTKFIVLTTADIRDPGQETTIERFSWLPESDDYIGNGESWPYGTGAHQSSTFIKSGGALYMIGMRHPGGIPFSGDDFADLYRIDMISDLHYSFTRLQTRHFYCDYDVGRICNFTAANNAYVSPSGQLILYSMPHDDVDETNPDFTRLGEFRNVNMTYNSSLQNICSGWIELYDDNTGWNDSDPDRSMLFDFKDMNLDNWDDLDKYDKGFGDKASSLRWNLAPGQFAWLSKDTDNTGDRIKLCGSGSVDYINNLGSDFSTCGSTYSGGGFNDKISSVEIYAPIDAGGPYTGEEDQWISLSTAMPCGQHGVPYTIWSVSGPGSCTFSPSHMVANPDVRCNQPGTYTLTLDGGFFTIGFQSLYVDTTQLTLAAVNDPPVANDDHYDAIEDTPLIVDSPGILANDTDQENDPLTVAGRLFKIPSHGHLELTWEGGFTYTPYDDYCGTDSFSYWADDGTASSDETATVTINISCVNDPPIAVDDSYDTTEDTPLLIELPGVLNNDSDIDGDPLTAVMVSNPGEGLFWFGSDGAFSFGPADNACGTESFTYKANDGSLDSNIATVNINITCVNDAPMVDVGGPYDGLEGISTNFSFSCFDPDSGDNWTALVDWGDDSPAELLGAVNCSTGEFIKSHTYKNDGSYTVKLIVKDAAHAVGDDSTSITVTNIAPQIDIGWNASLNEGDTFTRKGFFYDPGDDKWKATVDYGEGAGTEILSLNGKFFDLYNLFEQDGKYSVEVCISDDDIAVCSNIQIIVANVDPIVTVDVTKQTCQYSDDICDVTFRASDVLGDMLTATTVPNPLVDNLGLTPMGCSVNDIMHTCTWKLSGTLDQPVGSYAITVTVNDADGGSNSASTTITTEHEDANVWLDEDNPITIKVANDGGTSGSFSLAAHVQEIVPDISSDCAAPDPGEINKAFISMTLLPVGPGSAVLGECYWEDDNSKVGYDKIATFVCSFDDIPVNTYQVQAAVIGDYYKSILVEGILIVYDPSLGFTTGGGWFYWPGTKDKTNFGYTMKYNKKLNNVKGNFLLIRHTEEGNYRIKSNALNGLALGETGTPPYGWASFNGKCTYQDWSWPEAVGNHNFLVYVEDSAEPGGGLDRFWIEVRDKHGSLIAELSMDLEAWEQATFLGGGNIIVPHKSK